MIKTLFGFMFLFHSIAFASDWKSEIISDATKLYSPIAITTFNKPLEIRYDDQATVGAGATQTELTLQFIIYKGLMESSRVTPDGLRMILCHELGHLFGGAPRKDIPMEWDGPIAHDGKSFLSSEAQADYYASLVCFRKMIALGDRGPAPDMTRPGPLLKKKCGDIAGYKGDEFNACLRAGLAGEDFLKVAFDFPISTEQEDSSIATKFNPNEYPKQQCRLDTIVNGALCSDSMPMVLDFDAMGNNSCRAKYALRPKCWYPY